MKPFMCVLTEQVMCSNLSLVLECVCCHSRMFCICWWMVALNKMNSDLRITHTEHQLALRQSPCPDLL